VKPNRPFVTSLPNSANQLGEPGAGRYPRLRGGHHTEEAGTATDAAQQRFLKDSELELSQSLWWRSMEGKPFPEEANRAPAAGNGRRCEAELHRIRRRLQSRSNGPAKRLDLNEASIDNLWSVGFTRTQAMRVVAQRARQGGFVSVDELDELPGFPPKLIASLKQRLTL
jgi:hypothetical protein